MYSDELESFNIRKQIIDILRGKELMLNEEEVSKNPPKVKQPDYIELGSKGFPKDWD
jgi:hypothetical protein